MKLKHLMDIVEIRTKIISMVTFFSAVLYQLWVGGNLAPERFFLLWIAVLCVDMGTTGFNTYFDFHSGVDTGAHKREADKVLVHEGVAPSTALLVSSLLFGLAVLIGLFLTWQTGLIVALAGGASMMAGFLYTGGPLPLSRTPLGEFFAGGFLGTVLFMITWYILSVPSGSAGFYLADPEILNISRILPPLLISLPFSALVASILTVNNTCDIKGDREGGRKTLSILLGSRWGERIVYILGGGAWTLSIGLAITGLLPRVLILTALPALLGTLKNFRVMHGRGYSHETKEISMGSISQIYLFYGLALSSAFLIDLLLQALRS